MTNQSNEGTATGSVFKNIKDLLSTVLEGVEPHSFLDRCYAVCEVDSESGSNLQYLDSGIFCTVSNPNGDVAFILTKLNAPVVLASDSRKAIPTIQFLRVVSDVIMMFLQESGNEYKSLSYTSSSSKKVASMLGIQGVGGVAEDCSLEVVSSNVLAMLNSVKVDYVKPYRTLVDNYIDKVLLEYSKLFESGFGFQKPKGIMTPEGFYYVRNEQLCMSKTFDAQGNCENFEYVDICNTLIELGFKSSNSPYFDPSDVLVNTNYIPKLLLYFALGCVPSNDSSYKKHHKYSSNWIGYKINVIKPYLSSVVFSTYIESMVKAGKTASDIRSGMDSLADVLTRCCLVMEWNMKLALKCRVTSIGIDFTQSLIPEQLFDSIYQSVGEIIARREAGFLEFKLVKDVVAYNSEPLFAYEALDAILENGQMPSWENVILGRLANDLTFTFDMSKYLAYHIVAASRMGKGVMSLGILASALGSKYPIAYLDSKPDMARTIYDICPSAAVCTAEQCASLGISEASFSATVPDYARQAMGTDSYDAFGGIIYAKMLQLLLLIAEVRFKVSEGGWTCLTKDELGWDYEKNSWTKLIAFVDELEKATVHLNDELGILKVKSEPFVATKKQMQDSATEDGSVSELIENAPMYAKFSNKLVKWERKLCSDLMTGSKAVFGKGQLQMIFIYQTYDQSDEARKNHKNEGLFSTLKEIPRTAKIIGGGASYYPDAAIKIGELGNVLTQQKRWFSLSTSEQSVLAKQERVREQLSKGTVVPFKPYLLLNSSGTNDACVSEFLNGSDDRRDKYLDVNGNIKEPRIGFEAYVDYMLASTGTSTTTKDLLMSGAVISQNVLSKLGYSSINAFIFDLSINSFKSVGELLELLRNGETVSSSEEVSFSSGVEVEPEAYKYTDTSSSNSSSFDIERRRRKMEEFNKDTYFPTPSDILEILDSLVVENQTYELLFETKADRLAFASRISSYVKEQGGIAL